MATSLQTVMKSSVSWTMSSGNNAGAVADSSYSYSKTLTNGTAADTADLLVVKTSTIAASGNTTFDLAASLVDPFGTTVTFARIRGFHFELTGDTTATSVLVGNGTNPWLTWVGAGTDSVRVRNGGCLSLYSRDATGYAVTAGTGDILKVVNEDGTNTATYKVVFVGASA